MADTGQWNVIVVDWSRLSRVVYIEARLHTYVVANEVNKFLQTLIDGLGVKEASIHLIGHSMGAQISGRVGLLLKKKCGKQIARITGK